MKTETFYRALLGFWIFLLTFTIAMYARGGEITPGYVFQNGEKNVTADKLNSMVNKATIGPVFYSGKNTKTDPETTDWFLLYDAVAGEIKKVTYNSLFLTNVNLIVSRNEATNLLSSHMFLMWDGNGYKKQSYGGLILTNLDLVANRVALTNPPLNMKFLGFDGSSNVTTYRSNLFLGMEQFYVMTNLPTSTAFDPTNLLFYYDQNTKSNRSITVSNFFGGIPVETTNDTNDMFLKYTTNKAVKLVTLDNVANTLSNVFPRVISAFYTNAATTSTNSLGIFTNYPASKLDVKMKMMCVTPDAGYAAGEIIQNDQFFVGGAPCVYSFSVVNGTYIIRISGGTPYAPNGGTITSWANWRVLVRITYYP